MAHSSDRSTSDRTRAPSARRGGARHGAWAGAARRQAVAPHSRSGAADIITIIVRDHHHDHQAQRGTGTGGRRVVRVPPYHHHHRSSPIDRHRSGAHRPGRASRAPRDHQARARARARRLDRSSISAAQMGDHEHHHRSIRSSSSPLLPGNGSCGGGKSAATGSKHSKMATAPRLGGRGGTGNARTRGTMQVSWRRRRRGGSAINQRSIDRPDRRAQRAHHARRDSTLYIITLDNYSYDNIAH